MTSTQSPLRGFSSMIGAADAADSSTAFATRVSADDVAQWAVARLDRPLSDRLAALVPQVPLVSRSSRLTERVREGDVRLVIADPSADGSSCAESLLEIREEFPSTLISIYTVLRAPVVRSLLELAGRGVKDVVLYQTDDTRARFAELVDRAAARPLTTAVIGLLAAPLSQLPGNLAAAIDVLFASPRRVRTVDDLAVVAHMTRRSVYRHLATAGIRSPRLLVSAARVTKAASLLAQPGRTVCEVAKALGYSKPELLSAQLRTLTGLRPRELRDRSHLREVPEMVAMRLLASQGESGVVPDAHE